MLIIDEVTMEIVFVVVASPGYSLEIYIDASVIHSTCHIGEMSYMEACSHDEGLNEFFYVDVHHSDVSCPSDEMSFPKR